MINVDLIHKFFGEPNVPMKYTRVSNTTGVPNKRVAGMFFEIFLGEKKEI